MSPHFSSTDGCWPDEQRAPPPALASCIYPCSHSLTLSLALQLQRFSSATLTSQLATMATIKPDDDFNPESVAEVWKHATRGRKQRPVGKRKASPPHRHHRLSSPFLASARAATAQTQRLCPCTAHAVLLWRRPRNQMPMFLDHPRPVLSLLLLCVEMLLPSPPSSSFTAWSGPWAALRRVRLPRMVHLLVAAVPQSPSLAQPRFTLMCIRLTAARCSARR